MSALRGAAFEHILQLLHLRYLLNFRWGGLDGEVDFAGSGRWGAIAMIEPRV